VCAGGNRVREREVRAGARRWFNLCQSAQTWFRRQPPSLNTACLHVSRAHRIPACSSMRALPAVRAPPVQTRRRTRALLARCTRRRGRRQGGEAPAEPARAWGRCSAVRAEGVTASFQVSRDVALQFAMSATPELQTNGGVTHSALSCSLQLLCTFCPDHSHGAEVGG
jgi:hypothetical protein